MESIYNLLAQLVDLIMKRITSSVQRFARARLKRVPANQQPASGNGDGGDAGGGDGGDDGGGSGAGMRRIEYSQFKAAYERFCYERGLKPQNLVNNTFLTRMGVNVAQHLVPAWIGVRFKSSRELVTLTDPAPRDTESVLAWFVRTRCKVTQLPGHNIPHEDFTRELKVYAVGRGLLCHKLSVQLLTGLPAAVCATTRSPGLWSAFKCVHASCTTIV